MDIGGNMLIFVFPDNQKDQWLEAMKTDRLAWLSYMHPDDDPYKIMSAAEASRAVSIKIYSRIPTYSSFTSIGVV